jgi:deazaflavin-dependent oxidoreductase (nitroreductase family)
MSDMVATANGDPLAQIAAYESMRQHGLLPRFLRFVGRFPLFAFFYRRIGPVIDPWLLRQSDGSLQARIGMPALLLTAKGAKSGLPRTSPLLYVRDGNDFLVVGTNFGQANHPAWTNNLLAHPRASIRIGVASVEIDATLATDAEFQQFWPGFVEVYPGYAGYLERSGRHPRMFRLKPVS